MQNHDVRGEVSPRLNEEGDRTEAKISERAHVCWCGWSKSGVHCGVVSQRMKKRMIDGRTEERENEDKGKANCEVNEEGQRKEGQGGRDEEQRRKRETQRIYFMYVSYTLHIRSTVARVLVDAVGRRLAI